MGERVENRRAQNCQRVEIQSLLMNNSHPCLISSNEQGWLKKSPVALTIYDSLVGPPLSSGNPFGADREGHVVLLHRTKLNLSDLYKWLVLIHKQWIDTSTIGLYSIISHVAVFGVSCTKLQQEVTNRQHYRDYGLIKTREVCMRTPGRR